MKSEEDYDIKEFEKQFVNIAGGRDSSIDKNILKVLTKNLDQNYSEQEVERLIEEITSLYKTGVPSPSGRVTFKLIPSAKRRT